MMMKGPELTTKQEQVLRGQTISDDQPGSVLRDFQMLLDFVGPHGFEASGKHNVLPLKFIGELDARLSRPLNLLTLRNFDLTPTSKGCICYCGPRGSRSSRKQAPRPGSLRTPEILLQWKAFNPTEQYFTLLETWLRIGRPEILGDLGWSSQNMLWRCMDILHQLPDEGRRFDLTKPEARYILGSGGDLYLVALMGLFGLLAVEHPRHSKAPWHPAGLEHTSFGDATVSLLRSRDVVWEELLPQEYRGNREKIGEEVSLHLPRFGAWQPFFQPYFPDWSQNLELPEFEPRQGTFIFRLSLGKIWRLIAMPSDATLADLVDVILASVKFDSDHLYEFSFRDRTGVTHSIYHPEMQKRSCADQFPIGKLPIELGQSMQLLYDFGDNWPFTVKLERIESASRKAKGPRILKKHGKSPVQYARWDEW